MSYITIRDANILGGGIYCHGVFVPSQTPGPAFRATALAEIHEKFEWPQIPSFLIEECRKCGFNPIAHDLMVERQAAHRSLVASRLKRNSEVSDKETASIAEGDMPAYKRFKTAESVGGQSAEYAGVGNSGIVTEQGVVLQEELLQVQDGVPVEAESLEAKHARYGSVTPAEGAKSIAESVTNDTPESATSTTHNSGTDPMPTSVPSSTIQSPPGAPLVYNTESHISAAQKLPSHTEHKTTAAVPILMRGRTATADFIRQKTAFSKELDKYENEAQAYMELKRLDSSNGWILSSGKGMQGYKPSIRGGIMKPRFRVQDMEWYRIQHGKWYKIQEERAADSGDETDSTENDGTEEDETEVKGVEREEGKADGDRKEGHDGEGGREEPGAWGGGE